MNIERFGYDSMAGITINKAEPTPHEKPDTQGTITEHSEENS
jgi:hypothetical protein